MNRPVPAKTSLSPFNSVFQKINNSDREHSFSARFGGRDLLGEWEANVVKLLIVPFNEHMVPIIRPSVLVIAYEDRR